MALILADYSYLDNGDVSEPLFWRAEPSRALWFQKPSQNEPDFFLSSVDTEIKAKMLS